LRRLIRTGWSLSDGYVTKIEHREATVSDKVTEYTGARWSIQSVEKLVELWKDGVRAELIAQTLQRPEGEVRAKAAELSLPQHVENSV
jgi:hypothetical protein